MKITDIPLIVLCAGKSSRMGSPKGLLKVNSNFWFLEHGYSFSRAGGINIIYVLGFDKEKYIESFPALKNSINQWVSIENINYLTIINKKPEKGQFSSIQTAASKFKDSDFKWFFLSPVDILPSAKATFNKLIAAINEEKKAVIPTYKGKKGHPVLLSLDFIKKIAALDENSLDARLDYFLKENKDCINLAEVDDKSICQNINTLEEYKKFVS